MRDEAKSLEQIAAEVPQKLNLLLEEVTEVQSEADELEASLEENQAQSTNQDIKVL